MSCGSDAKDWRMQRYGGQAGGESAFGGQAQEGKGTEVSPGSWNGHPLCLLG